MARGGLGGTPVDVSAAVPALEKLLQSETPRASLAAATALATIRPSDDAWSRIEAALHEDEDLQIFALISIANAKRPPAKLLDGVVALMHDERLGWEALRALPAFGEAAASQVPALLAMLDDPRLGNSAMSALTRLGPVAVDALPTLLARLNAAEGNGIYAIPAIDPTGEKSFAELRKALSDPELAQAAANTLASFKDVARPVRGDLAPLLDSDDLPTRTAAIGALEEIGEPTPEAVAKVLAIAREGRTHECVIAMRALGSWKAPEALATSIEALDDPRVSIRREAIDALGALESAAVDARPKLRAIFADSESAPQDLRIAALEALIPIGLEATDVPLLVEELESRNYSLRLAAIEGLASLGQAAAEALGPLERIYADSSPSSEVRRQAGAAIRAISPERAQELKIPVEETAD
jgi:HEAT repeat protein